MYWLDWMTNLAGLFIWLAWRGFGSSPVSRGLTLVSNLKPAGREREGSRWLLPGLFGLLVARALIHHQFPSQFADAAVWSPGAVSVTFRSDLFQRMLAYSFLSWIQALLFAYVCFAFFAGLQRTDPDPDPITRSFRTELGRLSRWPAVIAPLPFLLLAGLLWLAVSGWLASVGLLPPFATGAHRWQQAGVVALGVLPGLKWPLVAMCVLRFLLDHVYLGPSPVWDYSHATGGRLSRWLRWVPLRFGTFDLTPLLAAAAYWGAGYFLDGAIPRLFQRLPL
jgi:hypothetical protein